VATGLYFLLEPVQAQLYSAIGLFCVGAIVVGVRRNRPVCPAGWYLIAAGQAATLLGDLLWYLHEFRYGTAPPFPSLIDGVYLLTYPLTAGGVVMLIRSGSREQDDGSLIDGLIVATSMGLPAWAFLISPHAYDQSLTVAEQLVSMAYPLMDIMLVAVTARIMLIRDPRAPAFGFLVAGMVFWLASDIAYAVLASTYQSGHAIDGGWLLAYVAWAAAALHPSMRSLSAASPGHGGRITERRIALLGAAALVGPCVLGVQELRGEQADAAALVAGALVLFSLVLLRMAGLVRQVEANARELNLQGETLARTVATLRSTEAERKVLLDKIQRAAEEERIRIAAELHDRPIQQLTSLSYDVELARLLLEQGRGEDAGEVLAAVQRSLGENVHGIRRLMSSLRPPALDERGLQAALRDQVEAFGERAHINCTVDADLHTRLDPELETVLYRVAQEALTNVAKHAHASHAWIQLKEEDGAVVLRLEDDGIGFIPESIPDLAREGHFGLIAMRERVQMAGGRCELESRPGAGTTIRVVFETASIAA